MDIQSAYYTVAYSKVDLHGLTNGASERWSSSGGAAGDAGVVLPPGAPGEPEFLLDDVWNFRWTNITRVKADDSWCRVCFEKG